MSNSPYDLKINVKSPRLKRGLFYGSSADYYITGKGGGNAVPSAGATDTGTGLTGS
jgi:hypothetical protein